MKISKLFLVALLFSTVTNSFCQSNVLASYKNYFAKDLQSWTNSFNNFQLSEFTFSDTIAFMNTPFGDINNLKDFYGLYKPGLTFSIDSSHFIDIYSYWLNLEKKGNKIVSNTEVDQAVSLCDLKNNRWTQILFCGVSLTIDEVIWVTNTKFILTGKILDDKNLLHPEIFVGDIEKQILLTYTDALSTLSKTDYTSEKFKKLNIRDE